MGTARLIGGVLLSAVEGFASVFALASLLGAVRTYWFSRQHGFAFQWRYSFNGGLLLLACCMLLVTLLTTAVLMVPYFLVVRRTLLRQTALAVYAGPAVLVFLVSLPLAAALRTQVDTLWRTWLFYGVTAMLICVASSGFLHGWLHRQHASEEQSTP